MDVPHISHLTPTILCSNVSALRNLGLSLLCFSLQRIPSPLFILEIWKACFVGLIESPEGTEELKWTAFTFLKVRDCHFYTGGQDRWAPLKLVNTCVSGMLEKWRLNVIVGSWVN